MALRAKKPEAAQKRLKLFMFGKAGVGKTTCAIQFPSAYIIDCEKGTDNYDTTINAAKSVVFQSVDMDEVITEVRSLLTERHDFRTLVIDPITPLYQDLLDKAEKRVGSEFGRHYGEANKEMKRLTNLLMALDMNVIVTAHSKTEYGEGMVKIGETFDGWKRLDYLFDLVVELSKRGPKRMGRVAKTRIAAFPDGDSFEWSYDEVAHRYGLSTIEREAAVVTLASTEQVAEIKRLIDTVKLPDDLVGKWFTKAGVESFEDMPTETIQKCIEYVQSKINIRSEAA